MELLKLQSHCREDGPAVPRGTAPGRSRHRSIVLVLGLAEPIFTTDLANHA